MARRRKGEKIPRIIYGTWIGDHIPESLKGYLATWREVMPDYDIRILGLDDVKSHPWVDAALAAGKPVLASHWLRVLSVFETGGIYLDLDVEVLKRFDDLLGNDMFASFQVERSGACFANNAVFGAAKGHPFLKEALDYMAAFPLEHPEVENETGPRMFTKLLAGHGWDRADAEAHVEGVHLLPSTSFYPYGWQERFTPECVTPETYAIHRWAHTWGKQTTIVIPCYNQAEFLPDAIESALAQTSPPLEVIVVDDGSPDDVASVVARYPSVRYIRQDNRGTSAARNHGIREAKTEYVCCLDADDKLHPEYLEKLVGHADVVSSRIRCFGARDDLWIPPTVRPTVSDFLTQNRVHCASVFRRSVWAKAHGFDEAMRDGFEDWDFWTRCAAVGATFYVVPEELLFYRKHDVKRSHVLNSFDRAQVKRPEILAYMHAKYERLGITRRARTHRPRLTTPTVVLGVDVKHRGTRYAKGDSIPIELAREMYAAGLLKDDRLA